MASRRETPPQFNERFLTELETLFAWRRDVRHFRSDPLPDGLLENLVEATRWAPSVGYSQPARFVRVNDHDKRLAVIHEFERCNHLGAEVYEGELHERYSRLKLAGLREAPIHLAVFCDESTLRGHGLGRQTMPETLKYSVVMAIYTLWLVARVHGVGMGWVSILEPQEIHKILEVEEHWAFVAYLCIGYPNSEHQDPELYREGWEDPEALAIQIFPR